jgi:hypothetical protein
MWRIALFRVGAAYLGDTLEPFSDDRELEARAASSSISASTRRSSTVVWSSRRWSNSRRRTAAGSGRTARRRSSRHPRDHRLREFGHVTQD